MHRAPIQDRLARRAAFSIGGPLRALLAALLCVLVGCVSSEPDKRVLQYLNTDGFGNRYTGNAEEENYVRIGDTVSFQDSFHTDLKGSGRVDIDGTLMVPEAGPVLLAGLTRSEIEALLTQKLSPYYTETDIRVTILAGTKEYYMVGEVMAGPRPFQGDLTILEAILGTSIPDYTANLSRVKLIRADPSDPFMLEVDIANMLKSGDTTFNVHVQEKDIIYVPPTLLKKIADFISSLIVPFTTALSSVLQSIFIVNALERGYVGGGGYGGGYGGTGGGGGGIF